MKKNRPNDGVTLADWNDTRALVRELRLKRMTAQLEVKKLQDVLNEGFRDVMMPADELSALHTNFEKGLSAVTAIDLRLFEAENKLRKIVVHNSMATTGSNEVIAVGAL
jgi:hypothetical protein